jgi:hypothetical protein
MAPSCCETTVTGGATDPNTNYSQALLYLPFPTNNFNSSFSSNMSSFCSLNSNTDYSQGTPYKLIDAATSFAYDISVFILSDANGAYPNSSCFKRKYETSDGSLYANFGWLYVEYPTQQPYEIRIIVTQKCGRGCEVVPSELGKKRKLIFSKLMTAGFAPPPLYNIIYENWQNQYTNPFILVDCAELNIPKF